MGEALGLAAFEAPRQALFLAVPSGASKEYSERTAEALAKLINDAGAV
jgi:hypothetical protein